MGDHGKVQVNAAVITGAIKSAIFVRRFPHEIGPSMEARVSGGRVPCSKRV